MKFKDKNGNIFIPTSKCLEDEMKRSKFYTEVKRSTETKGKAERK